MPRNKSASFIENLCYFGIITQDEFAWLLSSTTSATNLALRDAKLIEELINAQRCTVEKIKIILIIQQIDRISLLVNIAHESENRGNDQVVPAGLIAFSNFQNNDYEVTSVNKLLTGNQPLDQLHRTASAMKSSFKTILGLIFNQPSAHKKFAPLYRLRGISFIVKLIKELLLFIPRVDPQQNLNIEWNNIRQPLQEELMTLWTSLAPEMIKKFYLEFWDKINNDMSELTNDACGSGIYTWASSKLKVDQDISNGCPTPSPVSSPRANSSPRLAQYHNYLNNMGAKDEQGIQEALHRDLYSPDLS